MCTFRPFWPFRKRTSFVQTLTADIFCAISVRVAEGTAIEVQEAKLRTGRRIVSAREHAGFSQRDLAERLVKRRGKHAPGTDDFQKAVTSMLRTLRRHENGHNMPRGDLLMAIAAETGVEPSHFTTEDATENRELRQLAKEMIAPFQRRDGGRPARRVPAARRGEGRG